MRTPIHLWSLEWYVIEIGAISGLCPIVLFLFLAPSVGTRAQSHVQNAQIEGIVTDIDLNPVKATVTIFNVDSGFARTLSTRDSGGFSFPLLPLGKYSITVESAGFRRFNRKGIDLSAGQTETVDITLEPGDLSETVTVTADAPVTDPAKLGIAKNISRKEISALPLPSRNPFNFTVLQPGVAGRTVNNSANLRLTSNGLFRRVGMQIDGGINNDAMAPGFRLTFLSDVFVQEMQLLSGGYSAEFGNTAGSIVNVLTPSGSNKKSGSFRASLRPHWLGALPFGDPFQPIDQRASGWDLAVKFSGPIYKDRWHFYSGAEFERRQVPQIITVAESARAQLIEAGVSPELFAGSADTDKLGYYIVRSDSEIGKSAKLALRYTRFTNEFQGALAPAGNTINTTERSYDLVGWGQTIAAQYVAFWNRFFNEFRVQRAERIGENLANEKTGSGVSISIPGVVNLGPPINLGGSEAGQSSTTLQDATTYVRDRHTVKFGGGINLIRDRQFEALFAQYTFLSVGDLIRATSNADSRGYSQYIQSFGNTNYPIDTFSVNLFLQDERRVSDRFRISGGVRYELFLPPRADPNAPFVSSRKFSVDKNNFGPRIGASFLLRDGRFRTVARAAAGVHYDPLLLKSYRRARSKDGSLDSVTVRFLPSTNGAPSFPDRVAILPPTSVTGLQDVDTVSPGLRAMYAVHSNFQVEQAIGDDMGVTLGFLYSFARQIPVYRNINCLATSATLADGRPQYGTVGNPCIERPYPQFGLVMMLESGANMAYRGAFLRVARRYSSRAAFDFSYTYSTANDDAPEDFANAPVVVSDPSNRKHDYGASSGDVRHVVRVNVVAEPRFPLQDRILSAIANGYQMGFIVMADSGEVQNIVTGLDLNRDGVFGGGGPDRPVGIRRNALRIPAFFNLDLRLSRSIPVGERISVQLFGEASNVLNGKFVSAYNAVLPAALVDANTGLLRGPLPDFSQTRTTWRASRQVVIGARLSF